MNASCDGFNSVVQYCGLTVVLDPITFESALSTVDQRNLSGDAREVVHTLFRNEITHQSVFHSTLSLDIAQIDVILLSTPQSFLSLPFLFSREADSDDVELSHCHLSDDHPLVQFHGKIICTKPVYAQGVAMLESLYFQATSMRQPDLSSSILASIPWEEVFFPATDNQQQLDRSLPASDSKSAHFGPGVFHSETFRTLPPAGVLTVLLPRIQCVTFHQVVSLSPTTMLQALPSGLSLGSAFWKLSSADLRHVVSSLDVGSSSSSSSSYPSITQAPSVLLLSPFCTQPDRYNTPLSLHHLVTDGLVVPTQPLVSHDRQAALQSSQLQLIAHDVDYHLQQQEPPPPQQTQQQQHDPKRSLSRLYAHFLYPVSFLLRRHRDTLPAVTSFCRSYDSIYSFMRTLQQKTVSQSSHVLGNATLVSQIISSSSSSSSPSPAAIEQIDLPPPSLSQQIARAMYYICLTLELSTNVMVPVGNAIALFYLFEFLDGLQAVQQLTGKYLDVNVLILSHNAYRSVHHLQHMHEYLDPRYQSLQLQFDHIMEQPGQSLAPDLNVVPHDLHNTAPTWSAEESTVTRKYYNFGPISFVEKLLRSSLNPLGHAADLTQPECLQQVVFPPDEAVLENMQSPQVPQSQSSKQQLSASVPDAMMGKVLFFTSVESPYLHELILTRRNVILCEDMFTAEMLYLLSGLKHSLPLRHWMSESLLSLSSSSATASSTTTIPTTTTTLADLSQQSTTQQRCQVLSQTITSNLDSASPTTWWKALHPSVATAAITTQSHVTFTAKQTSFQLPFCPVYFTQPSSSFHLDDMAASDTSGVAANQAFQCSQTSLNLTTAGSNASALTQACPSYFLNIGGSLSSSSPSLSSSSLPSDHSSGILHPFHGTALPKYMRQLFHLYLRDIIQQTPHLTALSSNALLAKLTQLYAVFVEVLSFVFVLSKLDIDPTPARSGASLVSSSSQLEILPWQMMRIVPQLSTLYTLTLHSQAQFVIAQTELVHALTRHHLRFGASGPAAAGDGTVVATNVFRMLQFFHKLGVSFQLSVNNTRYDPSVGITTPFLPYNTPPVLSSSWSIVTPPSSDHEPTETKRQRLVESIAAALQLPYALICLVHRDGGVPGSKSASMQMWIDPPLRTAAVAGPSTVATQERPSAAVATLYPPQLAVAAVADGHRLNALFPIPDASSTQVIGLGDISSTIHATTAHAASVDDALSPQLLHYTPLNTRLVTLGADPVRQIEHVMCAPSDPSQAHMQYHGFYTHTELSRAVADAPPAATSLSCQHESAGPDSREPPFFQVQFPFVAFFLALADRWPDVMIQTPACFQLDPSSTTTPSMQRLSLQNADHLALLQRFATRDHICTFQTTYPDLVPFTVLIPSAKTAVLLSFDVTQQHLDLNINTSNVQARRDILATFASCEGVSVALQPIRRLAPLIAMQDDGSHAHNCHDNLGCLDW